MKSVRPFSLQVLRSSVLVATLGFSACKPANSVNEIRVDHVAKEDAAPPAAAPASLPISGSALPAGASVASGPTMPSAPSRSMTALPGMAEFVAATPTPKWAPPADWAAQPLDPVRKGTWLAPAPATAAGAKPAEVSVNVFQGALGGLLANVNRWRTQVGLPGDLTDATLGASVQNLSVGGRPAQLISLDGPDGKSLEGVLLFRPDRVWSFRMIGDKATVAAQRPAFKAFIDSVQWQD